MIREAELADMEKKWQEQNARIMARARPPARLKWPPLPPKCRLIRRPVLAPHAPADPGHPATA
jgi:sec-independent protein translocase protein TatB